MTPRMAADTTTQPDLPAVYSPEHINAELNHWRTRLTEARAGTGRISEQACLAWIDIWLDKKLDRRGR